MFVIDWSVPLAAQINTAKFVRLVVLPTRFATLLNGRLALSIIHENSPNFGKIVPGGQTTLSKRHSVYTRLQVRSSGIFLDVLNPNKLFLAELPSSESSLCRFRQRGRVRFTSCQW